MDIPRTGKRKRFGEILIDAGLLNEAVLQRALEKQKGTGKRLGQILEEMDIVAERDIAAVLACQFGFKTVRNISQYSFPKEILEFVTSEQALEKLIFPLKRKENTLYLAMVNPLDMETLDNLSFQTGMSIIPCVTTPSEIQGAVRKYYFEGGKEASSPSWWTILVVDDGELVRAAAVAALKKEGFILLEAANGAEGLKVATQNPPHLVIADTIMPRMDGYEMFRALQSNVSTRNIPVIGLSARSSAEEEAKLLDMGYFDFIAKPVNPTRLVARVKRALKFVYGDEPPAPN